MSDRGRKENQTLITLRAYFRNKCIIN